ncbi:hypothetical protein FE63_15550, partial [Staphylococcus aureus]
MRSGQGTIGFRVVLRGEPLDQFDDFDALARSQLQERLQQSKAFHGIARWGSELRVQLRDESGILHLAPITGNNYGSPKQTRRPCTQGRY